MLMSTIWRALSPLQQERLRVLDQLLDADEELDGFAAVDDAVVVGQGQVHHRTHHDITLEGDRALLDAVHAQNADLRRAEDRRRHERAEDTAVGDRESATTEIV